ncbi:MAG TPA: endonuclease domain-containing protein [Beijerinckiaceae bacterium]|nr:endonuclease domain-containing protein [Beijerinckiaceae bacterium]
MRKGQKLHLARALRREPTEVEKVMWRLLRNRQFANIKFRRQYPVGPFVADFACPSQRVIIELDGSQHAENVSDQRRDAYLVRNGWRVLRFWNADVMENPNAVLFRIGQAIGVNGIHPEAALPSPGRHCRADSTSPASQER